ncbi:MAG: hypothetical protein ABIP48_17020 [Planctomycetota bacterium]
MTLPEDPLHFVVSNFAALEEQLRSCLEYVPFIEQNSSVVSPKFIPILMDACSLIDSAFRHQMSNKGHQNIRTFAAEHEAYLQLENATTILLVSPIQLLRPFRGWQNAAPAWWNAYNQVKHDRIGNYAAATYTHTVTAMAGLHQILARSRLFHSNLLKAGWFNEHDAEGLMDLLAAREASCGPPELPVESRLFVSAIRSDFAQWNLDPPGIEVWNFTERVKNFIFEDEGVQTVATE